MPEELPIDLVERQEWLEPVESGLQRAVAGTFDSAGNAGRVVRNALHGVWLGHPLHPALTDIPLGAWTAAVVLDAAGENKAAAVAVKIGLAGAVGSAITGLTDWQATDGPARRVGIVHGLLNVTATALFAASLGSRKSRRPWLLAGFGISMAAAYLGGHLVFRKRIGIDHSAGAEPPAGWRPSPEDVPRQDGEMRRVQAGEARVLLACHDGEVHALGEVCSHLGGPLAEGKLEGDVVTCPWHGSRFCISDGAVVDGPATHPQPSYGVVGE